MPNIDQAYEQFKSLQFCGFMSSTGEDPGNEASGSKDGEVKLIQHGTVSDNSETHGGPTSLHWEDQAVQDSKGDGNQVAVGVAQERPKPCFKDWKGKVIHTDLKDMIDVEESRVGEEPSSMDWKCELMQAEKKDENFMDVEAVDVKVLENCNETPQANPLLNNVNETLDDASDWPLDKTGIKGIDAAFYEDFYIEKVESEPSNDVTVLKVNAKGIDAAFYEDYYMNIEELDPEPYKMIRRGTDAAFFEDFLDEDIPDRMTTKEIKIVNMDSMKELSKRRTGAAFYEDCIADENTDSLHDDSNKVKDQNINDADETLLNSDSMTKVTNIKAKVSTKQVNGCRSARESVARKCKPKGAKVSPAEFGTPIIITDSAGKNQDEDCCTVGTAHSGANSRVAETNALDEIKIFDDMSSIATFDNREEVSEEILTQPCKSEESTMPSRVKAKEGPRGKILPVALVSKQKANKTDPQNILVSNRWKKVPHKSGSRRKAHWLSPKFRLKFRTMVAALEFNGVCDRCNRNEEEACAIYLRDKEKEGCKFPVVGGRSAVKALLSTTSDSQCLANEDDGSCDEGGALSTETRSTRKDVRQALSESNQTNDSEVLHDTFSSCPTLQDHDISSSEPIGGEGCEVAPAVVNGEGDEHGPNNAIRQRHKILTSNGWSIERVNYHTVHKISPKRKLKFIRLHAAEDFETLRRECDGDENKAAVLYEMKMKQEGRQIASLVVGGFTALMVDKNKKLVDSLDLVSNGWTISKDHMISPKRKLQFISTAAAQDFESIRQECNGNEAKASVQYEKKIKRDGTRAALLVVGGFKALSITPRQLQLVSKGWEMIPGKNDKVHKESPGRKLQFISTEAAEAFEVLREKCKGDETNASVLFEEKMRQEGREVAKMLVGGLGALSLDKSKDPVNEAAHRGRPKKEKPVSERDIVEKPKKKKQVGPGHGVQNMRRHSTVKALDSAKNTNPRDDQDLIDKNDECFKHDEEDPRYGCLLAKGWAIRKYVCGKSTKKRWVSPRQKIVFKLFKAAEKFDIIRREFNDDERIAARRFAEQLEEKPSYYVVGGLPSLLQFDCSNEKCNEASREKSFNASGEAKEMEQQQSVLDDTETQSNTFLSKKLESRANSQLAELSPGWLAVPYKCKSKEEVHFETPYYRVRFKSFKSAKEFDNELKQCPERETEVLDAYTKDDVKARCRIYSYGTYRKISTKRKRKHSDRNSQLKNKKSNHLCR